MSVFLLGAQNNLHVDGHTFHSAWKGQSQKFEDSGCSLYFTYELLNSTPQYLSSIDYTGIEYCVIWRPKAEIMKSK
jgi:hypothetical protein